MQLVARARRWIGGSAEARAAAAVRAADERYGAARWPSRHAGPLPAASRRPSLRIDEEPGRRWYPVIDYSRCTNCMECIDFCLFGVYGVDKVETILVEQPTTAARAARRAAASVPRTRSSSRSTRRRPSPARRWWPGR